jgi:hypothetical protein
VQVLRRGTSGMDAARGVKGQGWPFTPAPGAIPEGGELSGAKPGCRGAFSLVTFSCAQQEKVTRPRGRKQID